MDRVAARSIPDDDEHPIMLVRPPTPETLALVRDIRAGLEHLELRASTTDEIDELLHELEQLGRTEFDTNTAATRSCARSRARTPRRTRRARRPAATASDSEPPGSLVAHTGAL